MSERRSFFVNRQGLRPVPDAGQPVDRPLEAVEIEVRLGETWARGRVLASRREGGFCEVQVAYSTPDEPERRRESWFNVADVRAIHLDD